MRQSHINIYLSEQKAGMTSDPVQPMTAREADEALGCIVCPFPFPLALACALLLGARCTSTQNVVAPATPKPKRFMDRQVLAILPSTAAIEFVLNGGERAGISPDDRGYMRCIDIEVRIFQAFDFRSRARMDLTGPWPKFVPGRMYLNGADPKPWCPDPDRTSAPLNRMVFSRLRTE